MGLSEEYGGLLTKNSFQPRKKKKKRGVVEVFITSA